MAYKSEKLLKSILLNVEKAKTLKEAREVVELLFDKEDVVAAKQLAAENEALSNKS